MNPTIINETASPGGNSYNINGDYVATAFFYNKDMFTKAGITQPPKTWQELLDVSQKLKAAGMNPYVGVPYWGWMNRHFLTDFYGKDYAALSGVDKQPGFSALDEAANVYKGTLSPKDPRFMAWWPVFKQFTDFWVKDYITQPPDNQDTAQRDFEAGKAAMFYSGSWLPNQLRDNKVTFQYGSFNFPTLGSAVSQYSSGQDVSNAVGGPSGAYQFAMSTPRSNKTMNEAGKSDAVLDWMRYIGTPKVAEKIINESGSFIPTWNGAKPKEGTELLVNQANQKLQVIRVDNTSAKLDDDIQGIFGLYLSGNINLDQATQQMQQTLDRATQDYATKNKVDLSTYKS